MQENVNGQIAVRRYRQNRKRVIISDKRLYHFIPKNNICMAWVDPEDLQAILNIKYKCCGNSSKQEFFIASETDVRRYLYGGV